MTTSEPSVKAVPLVVRVLSAIAGITVFLLGLVVSLGAIVAAPLGMWLVRRWEKRRDRPAGRVSAIVGGVVASSVLAVLLWGTLFLLAPRPSQQELQSAVAQSQARSSVKLPDWYAKAFPQAAQTDSATQKMIQSPGFMRLTLMFSLLFLGVLLGVLGGVTGWASVSLLRVSWSRG